MGLRDTILQAQDLKRQSVEVPEWNCTVFVRMLSGEERLALDEWVNNLSEEERQTDLNIIVKTVLMTACDESGSMLFSDSDIPALRRKAVPALLRVFDASMLLNKLGREGQEQVAKN